MTGATMSDGTPAVADGRVYVGNETADRVIAYDAATGQQLWVAAPASAAGRTPRRRPATRLFIGSTTASSRGTRPRAPTCGRTAAPTPPENATPHRPWSR